ncbi:predicted protein [Postia placenta Mad-698-R]|uniref:Cytochrome b5 heme-binding domain-containing protein n=1 Tax=Postia placenta MAD-698-R-SB12 TaxID=670580 RepID=A0A1X6MMQ0_9APHY|nr:hypothetical protein POSPLADRAFT_1155871 [Postia placenta MAD-698-R-SB12]EED79850.1 predicted protein [Postia placenta Mad-698-R]OSX57701.1 hypothetical protein POSPLADRAFT_1155871 [Postia placenta MAD-698-R-SB12]
MAGYLRSWFASPQPAPTLSVSPIIESPSQSDSVDNDDSDTETIHGGDTTDDIPPSFPAANSAQRLAPPSNTIPRILTDAQLMPPPPPPSLSSRRPGISSTPGSLAVPLTTSRIPPKPSGRGKVALAPGHGPLDWANLKKSGQDLRGVESLLRVTPSMLKQHNKRDDAWSAFNGKVYNITHYLPYHPGGEKELIRVAGRDGSKLFALTHAWVNLEYMLDSCLVGFLVAES